MEANNASQVKLEGLDSTKYPSLTNPTELSIGSRFNSWEIAEHYLKEHGRQRGFVVNRYRVEFHKCQSENSVRIVKKRTFSCEYSGNKPESSDFVHITFMHLEHNHEILIDNARFATTFRKFDQSIVNEILRTVVYGCCDAYTIRNLLQPLYPDQLFLTQDLSNTIQKIKREKQIAGSDASYLLKLLLEQQKEEPMTFVQPLINVDIVSSSSTIANVAEALDSRMQKEELNKSFIAWKYQSTIYHQPFVVENFFSNINIIIQKYFSPRIHKQMRESVLYRCEKLDIDDAFEFIEDQSNEIYENQISDYQEEIHNIEDYYDYRQTYLRALLNSVQKEKIKEHIILLDDGTHLCTCLLLVSHGIICRHYFKLMIENSSALFHIMLMLTRWLQDNAWNNIDSIFNEPFVRTSSKNLKSIHNDDDSQRAYLIPKHHNNIQEVEIRRHTQKKINYGRIMGHFKQALNYSLDDND
ncbi:697_t:CDS:2 [Diversispora eburnea]|uniref:697_t:CDS:1 n=1 Tax=Diversispora eburnea TaxID=1213867 RepID=A0A9N9BL11_9GLOM|nr:697_t:CDS:2 [Diversispora eburnea]